MTKKTAGGAPLAPAQNQVTQKSPPPNFHTDDGRIIHVPGLTIPVKGYDIRLALQNA